MFLGARLRSSTRRRIRSVLFAALILAAGCRPGLPPPKGALLRHETGMHTASIMALGFDDSQSRLLTASLDKTARIWEVPGGRLAVTLRVPSGDGWEGMLRAAAFSPDGTTVACGGVTRSGTDGSFSIYLFDCESGRLRNRIPGLPDTITGLAFSKDGTFLAAALRGKNGIRVYRTADASLVAQDRSYADHSLRCDFDRAGRLVTSSFDGHIRLYDPRFRLIAKVKAPGGSEPIAARFSPDGRTIAVVYSDTTNVNVLSGDDLSLRFSPDTSRLTNGHLLDVAWSNDGRFLYAAGTYAAAGRPVLRWANGGTGECEEIPSGSRNYSVMRLAAYGNSGIAWAAYTPMFALVDDEGRLVLQTLPATADLSDTGAGLMTSEDGTEIRFAYDGQGRAPARFSVTKRRLEEGDLSFGLSPPRRWAEGMTVAGWWRTTSPTLNGAPLRGFLPGEIVYALAVSPDGGSFLLGTQWSLALFDRGGSRLWSVNVPEVCWSVNIAGNGKVAVAAFGDGTIRWFRMSDGRDLLAFFPHADRKRWVLWSPSGYYDSSPGGDDLLVYQIDKGPQQAPDIVPASLFREARRRPGVIADILATLDEGESARRDAEETQRLIEIQSP